jgi:hypothetical protein
MQKLYGAAGGAPDSFPGHEEGPSVEEDDKKISLSKLWMLCMAFFIPPS